MDELFHAIRAPTGCRVWVKGKSLSPRKNWRNYSAHGFDWGFEGAGSAQLALAMLAHVFERSFALEHCQCFKREVLAKIEADEWFMGFDELRAWRKAHLGCVYRNNQTTQLLFDQPAANGVKKQ